MVWWAEGKGEGVIFREGVGQRTVYFFKKDFIYLFLERREGREKEGEKHQ